MGIINYIACALLVDINEILIYIFQKKFNKLKNQKVNKCFIQTLNLNNNNQLGNNMMFWMLMKITEMFNCSLIICKKKNQVRLFKGFYTNPKITKNKKNSKFDLKF
jgi:hypothetical protein